MLKLSILLGALGGIMILLAAILGAVVFPRAVDNKIKSELRLVRGSSTWNKWIEIETPVYIKFYIFNVTNPEEVNSGDPPILDEVGPYVYRQRRQKLDPLSENCKETVKYEQRITYFFDQEKSGNNTEEDLVNIVNVPFVSVMKSLETHQPQLVPIVARQLYNESLIRSGVIVGELTFRGFDVSDYNETVIGGNLPEEFSGLRFGIYKGRNGSTDGQQYEVFTGTKDVKLFGSIKKWNGNSSLSYWGDSDDECNKLTGTDGSIFRPFLEKESTITIFSSDVCRQLKLTYKEEKTVKDIKGYRFTLPKEELQGAAENPDNSCYCMRNITECQNGIIDVGVCRNEAPIVLSTPNFLDGYEGYATAMGLIPNRTLHETTVDIEPRSGLLLEAHKRIQINLDVRRIENVTQLEPIQDPLLFPVLWVDEEARICDVDADDFRSRVQSPIKTVKIVKWVAIGVGSALVIVGFLIPFLRRNKKSTRTA